MEPRMTRPTRTARAIPAIAPVDSLLDELDWLAAAAEADEEAEDEAEVVEARLDVTVSTEGLIDEEVEVVEGVEDELGRRDC